MFVSIFRKFKNEEDISIENEGLISTNLTFEYEIRNFGPSNIRDMYFTVDIPSELITSSSKTLKIVDLTTLNIISSYEKRELNSFKSIIASNLIPQQKQPNEFVESYDTETRQIIKVKQNLQTVFQIPSEIEETRLVFISCTKSTELSECIQAMIQIKNFKAGPQTMFVQLKFAIDLAEIGMTQN